MKASSQSGSAVVEFAIILPILFLVLFGIIEFGLLFVNKQMLVTASREGARLGIVSGITDNEIIYRVREVCESQQGQSFFLSLNSIPLNDIQVQIVRNGMSFEDDLKVTVRVNYQFLTKNYLGFGLEKLIASSTVMKMQQTPE